MSDGRDDIDPTAVEYYLPPAVRCSNCLWRDIAHRCRRFPPSTKLGGWPWVDEADYCGEFTDRLGRHDLHRPASRTQR